MKHKFVKFQSLSMKAKMNKIQERLKSLGYDVDINCKRDKKTIKAIMKFQTENDITPNGVICEKTFNKMFSN